MPEHHLSIVCYVDNVGMLLVSVLALQIGVELLLLVLASFPKGWLFLFLDPFVEEELVVQVEVALGDDLEE